MNVLLLTTHLNIGGVTSYTINLAKGLKKKGFFVYVASGGGELARTLENTGIPHLKVGVKTKCEFHPKLIFSFFKLRALIKEKNIHIIHAQTRVTQVLGYLLALSSDAGYVATCHGFFKKKRISRRLFGAWGERVIAISDAVRDHLIRDLGVKKENVSLIYNGVDSDSFSLTVDEDEKGSLKDNLGFTKSPIIGSISRLSPVKGLPYLLFAMKGILRRIPDLQLLLVGEGPSKDHLMELAKKLGIAESVFFALNTTETKRFLSIIDVFVFYSLEEGLGLSLLEAMAAGKPCIASNVGGVSSVIEDGVTGFLIPPKDAHALEDAIVKALSDRRLSATLAERGTAVVKTKFSLEGMVEKVINIYEKAKKK